MRGQLLFCVIVLLFCVSTLPVYSEEQVQQHAPVVSEKRVIFTTNYGDLVFAFYPEVAPGHMAQITNLVTLGLYNSVQAFRIIPGFVLQFEEIHERSVPFSREQSAALVPIKAEFSAEIKHSKGLLSMARWENNPDSAVSSFSILLGNAPHLDGQYTVFGFLESGGSVVNKILSIPLRRGLPSKKIYIKNAYVVNHKEEYYSTNALDAEEITEVISPVDSTDTTGLHRNNGLQNVMSILVGVIVVISLLGFVLQNRINKNHVVSLLLVNVLIGVFVLMIVLLPRSSSVPWLSVLLFAGMFALFRIMSNFERKS